MTNLQGFPKQMENLEYRDGDLQEYHAPSFQIHKKIVSKATLGSKRCFELPEIIFSSSVDVT